MKNIIFNRNEYSQLSPKIRELYVSLGGYVYALKPRHFVLDMDNLPKWLSREQYTANRGRIGNVYTLVTRGFAEAIPLMQLQSQLAYNIRRSYISPTIPGDMRVIEEIYHRLPASEKAGYKRVEKGALVYYTKKRTKLNQRTSIPRQAVRQPIVGIRKPPVGRWVEVK